MSGSTKRQCDRALVGAHALAADSDSASDDDYGEDSFDTADAESVRRSLEGKLSHLEGKLFYLEGKLSQLEGKLSQRQAGSTSASTARAG